MPWFWKVGQNDIGEPDVVFFLDPDFRAGLRLDDAGDADGGNNICQPHTLLTQRQTLPSLILPLGRTITSPPGPLIDDLPVVRSSTQFSDFCLSTPHKPRKPIFNPSLQKFEVTWEVRTSAVIAEARTQLQRRSWAPQRRG